MVIKRLQSSFLLGLISAACITQGNTHNIQNQGNTIQNNQSSIKKRKKTVKNKRVSSPSTKQKERRNETTSSQKTPLKIVVGILVTITGFFMLSKFSSKSKQVNLQNVNNDVNNGVNDTGSKESKLSGQVKWVNRQNFDNKAKNLPMNIFAEPSPKGNYILSQAQNGAVVIWDVNTKQVVYNLQTLTEGISSVELSPDEKNILVAGKDGKLILADITNNKHKDLSVDQDKIVGANFLPNGKMFTYMAKDKTTTIKDLNGNLICNLTDNQVGNYIANHTKFSQDGKLLLMITDKLFAIRNIETEEKKLSSVGKAIENNKTVIFLDNEHPYKDSITNAHFSPNGQQVLSVSRVELKIWNAQSGAFVHNLKFGGPSKDSIQNADFLADGSYVAAATNKGKLLIFNVEQGNLLKSIEGHNSMNAFSISPDRKKMVSGDEHGNIKIWEVESKQQKLDVKCIQTLTSPSNKPIINVAFTPDNKKIIVSALGDSIKILEEQSTQS